MADNFNLAKFLRNNRLLNESIGGYKDIEPMKEEDQETDGFEDTASGLMVYWGKKPSGDKAILVKKHGKDLSPDEQEKLSAKEFDTLSMLKRKAWLLGSKKKASEPISGMNEAEEEKSSIFGKDWEYKDDEFIKAVGEVDSALGVNVGDVIRNPNGSETLTVKRIVKKVNRGDDPENPKYPVYTAYLDSSIKAGRDEYPFDLYTLSKAIERGGYELNPVKEAKGYIQEIQMEGENPWLDDSIDGKKIGNWVANYDDQMGTVYLEHPMIEDIIVYATPGWEGVEGIALAISEDGEEKPWNEDGIVPGSKSSYESFEEYAADMVDVLNDIEFELTINQMIEGIEKGAGWIDPDYVQDTWENSSDIPFDSVASEIYTRLIDAGLLFYPDEDEPLEAGMQVRSLDQLNEAEEERAYFDYKNNRRSFLPSPDEFQGALDSSEMSKHDFMMGLADEGFDKDVSAIVSKTIEGLIKGGFGAQDIVDFLATDFSLDEGLDEAEEESGYETVTLMYYDHPSITNGFVNKSIRTFKKFVDHLGGSAKVLENGFDEIIFTLSGISPEELKEAFNDFVKAEFKKDFLDDPSPFGILTSWRLDLQKGNYPIAPVGGLKKKSEVDESFNIEKIQMEEAADFTKFVKVGNVYDNYHDATGGFRMKLKVTAVDPMNQTITAVDEKGRERKYSAYQFTSDFRAEDPNPIDSKWTDPGYKNRD